MESGLGSFPLHSTYGCILIILTTLQSLLRLVLLLAISGPGNGRYLNKAQASSSYARYRATRIIRVERQVHRNRKSIQDNPNIFLVLAAVASNAQQHNSRLQWLDNTVYTKLIKALQNTTKPTFTILEPQGNNTPNTLSSRQSPLKNSLRLLPNQLINLLPPIPLQHRTRARTIIMRTQPINPITDPIPHHTRLRHIHTRGQHLSDILPPRFPRRESRARGEEHASLARLVDTGAEEIDERDNEVSCRGGGDGERECGGGEETGEHAGVDEARVLVDEGYGGVGFGEFFEGESCLGCSVPGGFHECEVVFDFAGVFFGVSVGVVFFWSLFFFDEPSIVVEEELGMAL